MKVKIGEVFTGKFVGTGPLSYEKRIYWAAVSQRLRNTALRLCDINIKSVRVCRTALLPRLCVLQFMRNMAE